MTDRLQVLLPIYNEANSIKLTIEEIFNALKNKIPFEFILSEDGSTDGTKEILKTLKNKFPILLISDNQRKYYSKAVIDGINKASSEYLLIIDSDGQCDPNDIIKFWEKRKKSDIINGYREPRHDFAYRRFISNVFYFFYKILFNVPLRDPSFAFVFMNKNVYQELSNFKPLMPDGFFWEFNARAKKKNFSFNEIWINHRKRSSGDTKIYTLANLPKIAFKNGVGLLKLKFFD
jgi:glycosyltransferase involved in cell wall biosynthesis